LERGLPNDKSLLRRFIEQIYASNGPGTAEWTGHNEQMENYINRLDKIIEKMLDDGCPKPPWVTGFNNKHFAKDAERLWNVIHVDLPNALASLSLGYASYRVARILPSLVPPLWWTLPANVTIP
jgi:hypothetical protein